MKLGLVRSDRLNYIVYLHLGWFWSGLCGQVVFIQSWSLFRGFLYSISWWEESKVVFVDRWSLFTGYLLYMKMNIDSWWWGFGYDISFKCITGGFPPGLQPIHKASIVMFLERVYGIEDQATFFRLLEDCFLADLRAATTLDMVNIYSVKMKLNLNGKNWNLTKQLNARLEIFRT